jgi:hypothetical protein
VTSETNNPSPDGNQATDLQMWPVTSLNQLLQDIPKRLAWGRGSIPGRVTGDFFRSIQQVHVPGVDSASKNEYQDIPGGKGGRCVGVTTLPPSFAECHEIWEP